MDMMGDAGEDFNGYGCWCYFDELHGKGKSHPVDQMDACFSHRFFFRTNQLQ